MATNFGVFFPRICEFYTNCNDGERAAILLTPVQRFLAHFLHQVPEIDASHYGTVVVEMILWLTENQR